MSPRQIAFWMLATAGVAVGHIAGYGLAHPDAAAREAALGGHAYLPGVASIVVPLGVTTALVWAIRTARSLGMAGQIDATRLAAAQVAVFTLQELGERAITGDGALSALGERGVWFGLIAQVVVAHLVSRSVDVVRRIVRAVIAGPRRLTAALGQLTVPSIVAAAPASVISTVAIGPRGPPGVGQFR